MAYTAEEKKAARKKARAKWREGNRDHFNAYRRRRYATNAVVRKKSAAYQRERQGAFQWAWSLRQLGLTVDEYQSMFAEQKGLCAVCKLPRYSTYGRLHVDHDHDSGKIRGLLCGSCNRGIGLLGDDPEILRNASEYLKGARSWGL